MRNRGKRVRSVSVTQFAEQTYVTVIERSWPRWPSEPSVSRIVYREVFPADIAPWDLLAEVERCVREHLL